MYDFIGTMGHGAILMGFIASAAAVASYLISYRKPALLAVGRSGFHVTTVSVFVAAAALLILIVKHQFQYHYVWAYSSRDLPLGLLISTFYAGQEGSFMLWTVMISVIGIFLMGYTRRHDYEREVMPIYTTIMSFLLLLIVIKNPFELIEGGVVPPDGKGLNPLLQNFWMQIHPPMLFTGFASMAVPYAFAIAALKKKSYQEWIVSSMPWILGGAMILGVGIMLGGFWAYETLGWGGWWGWDPVENSSLIPWITCVALVHTMLAQRRTKGLVLTNFVLAILAFVLVLYSTFLTRSGVLGDASVHSFVDPGRFAFTLLVLFMFAFTDIGHGLLFIRFTRWGRSMWEKHTGFKRLALLYLLIVGPSIPIFAQISGDLVPVFRESLADANAIASVFLTVMLGIAHFLQWASWLWLPALAVKIGMIVYVLTGRLHSEKEYKSFELLSRETALGIGSALLLGVTLVVLLGTSLPIIPPAVIGFLNSILGGVNKVTGGHFVLGKTVDASFYDAMNLPLAMVIALLNGGAMLLKWKMTRGIDIWRKTRLSLGIALLLTLLIVLMGVHSPSMILFGFSAAFALVVNIETGIRILRGNPRFTGAYIAHVGIAFLFLGVIGSGFYHKQQALELELNKPANAFGYTFTYVGYEPFDEGKKFHFKVRMEKDGKEEAVLQPIMFISNYGGQDQVMRNPDIAEYLHKDVYIEPQALVTPDQAAAGADMEFAKGQTQKAGNYEITFVDFDLSGLDRGAMMSSGKFRIGGVFQVKKYGMRDMEEIRAFVNIDKGEESSDPVPVKDGGIEIALMKAKVNQEDMSKSLAEVRVIDAASKAAAANKQDTLVAQVSLKPFIGLVWAGVITMALGFAVAIGRRTREAKRLVPVAEENPIATPPKEPAIAKGELAPNERAL